MPLKEGSSEETVSSNITQLSLDAKYRLCEKVPESRYRYKANCHRERAALLACNYARMPRERISMRGHAYTTWSPVGVPRINDSMLDCVFYLYCNREGAEKGENSGGTGFWVAYESDKVPNAYWIFAVSNKHVVAEIGASVIRVNTKEGGVDIFEIEPHEWFFTHDDDLAIIHIPLDLTKHRVHAILLSLFVTKEIIQKHDLGPGDEIFMIGRFVKHDGMLTNAPSVRFGNYSITNTLMPHPSIGMQESFGVEMRSMGGYSGSPVFIYPSEWNMNSGNITTQVPVPLFLLGINWGHIVDHSEVKEKIISINTQSAGETRSVQYVLVNTGMNGVIPAWRLAELIFNSTWIPVIRRKEEELFIQATNGPDVVMDSAVLDDSKNLTHREDFTALLNAAVRKPQSKD
jgi:hypothetical protein